MIAYLTLLSLVVVGQAQASTRAEIVQQLKQEAALRGWTFEVGETPMVGQKEFGYKKNANARAVAHYEVPPEVTDLPWFYDWRDAGVVGPIRDQASPVYCGSCWAHGTAAAFESAIAIQTGQVPNVSPQQLVSCSSYGTCSGGDFAFGFYRQTGANHEPDFPYVARDVGCKQQAAKHEKAVQWGYVGQSGREPSIDEMKRAIFTYGPIAVTVASSDSWGAYKGGIYNACDSYSINHIVAIVGWNDADDTWIVKNSHGTQFGEQGYMRTKRLDSQGNKCNGIGESAAWVVYKP